MKTILDSKIHVLPERPWRDFVIVKEIIPKVKAQISVIHGRQDQYIELTLQNFLCDIAAPHPQ